MDTIIKFPFSKIFAFVYFVGTVGLFILTSWFIIFGKLNSPKDNLIPLILFDLVYLYFVIRIAKRYFFPAMNGQFAIELNKEGIINHIDSYKIEWVNILDIRLEGFWPNKIIAIELQNEKAVTSKTRNIIKKIFFFYNNSFFGTPIIIITIFIKGNRSDIFNTLSSYLRQTQNGT